MAKTYPDQLLHVDKDKRSVLALALESGHSMIKERYGDFGETRGSKPVDTFCILKLVEIDARVLGLKDPKTELYPFQTASSMEAKIAELVLSDYPTPTRGFYSCDASIVCLNTIYYLLRADPSALTSARTWIPR